MSDVRAAIELPEGRSLEDVMEDLRAAAAAKFGETAWSFTEHTEDGTVVVSVEHEGTSKHYRFEWSIGDDGHATLDGDGEEVEKKTSFEPVMASFTFGIIRAGTGRKFEIRVIGTGPGLNEDRFGPWYVEDTDDGIGSARKVFGGARVYWHDAGKQFDHLDADVRTWLGTNRDAGYLSDLRTSADGLFATLHVDEDVPEEVVAALREKALGFSVECEADRVPIVRGGKSFSALRNFRHPSDGQARVAIVSHPALRGEVMRLAASMQTKQKKESPVSESTTTATAEIDEQLKAARAAREETEKVLRAARVANGRAALETKLTASKLPEKSAALVRDHFEATFERGECPTDEDVQTRIDAVRDALKASDAKVEGLGGNVQVGAGGFEKFGLGLARLLLPMGDERVHQRYADRMGWGDKLLASQEQEAGIGLYGRATSYRRLVRDTMGIEVEDLFRPPQERRRLFASVNLTQWGDVFENVLNVMGYAYQENPDFDDWRKIVQIRSFSGSTLKQERVVTGGYANLPSVGEGANYTAATTPGDLGHGYSVLKYGFTEDWTREAQINDNHGQLQMIVQRMALAADRTKYEYFFDLLTIAGQPTMDYDSESLYAASTHSNLGTSALTATSLAAARLAMRKQADFANSKRLGLVPKFLIVPLDLEETAYNLLKASVEEPGGLTSERAWLRRMNLEVIAVRHWTNTGDHFIEADPMTSSIPVFEAGFLNGREMADIFVQDDPRNGSVFERDSVTVAIKQDYFGGTPLRHEAFYGQDV